MREPMTNYNERLDEILHELQFSDIEKPGIRGKNAVQAKQAITSLIKELVAEANPLRPQDGTMIMAQASYADGIRKFEQNLLKELEEV